MALRDNLARRSVLTNSITVGVILLAVAFTIYDFKRSHTPPVGTRLFFSDDDGRTTFADDAFRVPPFDHDGRTAVRAYVYACNGGRPFVAYLERLTPEGATKVLKGQADKVAPVDQDFILAEQTEVKRPGDADWVKRSSAAGLKLLDVRCPGGESGTPESVLPED